MRVLGKERVPAGRLSGAVGGVVRLWFHKMRPGWVGSGLAILGVWLSFLSSSWLSCCPCSSDCLSSLSCAKVGVSPKNLYQETKRKETDRKSGQKYRHGQVAAKYPRPLSPTKLTSRLWAPSKGSSGSEDTLSITSDLDGVLSLLGPGLWL